MVNLYYAISVDLSKSFDTINYNLFIAKLQVWSFSMESFKLIASIYQIDGKEQNSTQVLVCGLKYFC